MSKRIWYVYVGAAAVYVSLIFLVPTEAATLERYKLSEFRADLLSLSIAIPLLVIWFAAFYGYDKFKHYAQTIGSAPDGHAFNYIANGLGILAIGLPITSILSSLSNFLTVDSPDLIPATTIIRNYVSILIPLAAFWFIYKGSQQLTKVASRRKKQSRHNDSVAMLTAFLAVFYTYLIFQNPNREVPDGDAWRATYYLPDLLVLFTIILPYLYIWLLGFRAVLNISTYMSSVKGVLYKQMLGHLAKGLTGIILISIVLQLLVNFGSLFRSMSLAPLLGIIYLLLTAMAVGYVYVAAGAKRLQKIEEV